ncbi:MAG TPA: SDR family NAD(P)-dependent oxidoreductase, partial [Pricia sp.]|nr:SDR family NAD(P)-dependent oxidoreductase [Pricia sp.]
MKENKVALVTEAGNDLGKEFAHILSENGYQVILAACGDSYKSLSQDGDALRPFELVEIDFSSESGLKVLGKKINACFGKLDLLVNNAEIVNGFGQKIDQLNMDEVRKVYEINLFSVIGTIRTLKPLLQKSEHPRIINITSSLGDIDQMKDENFCYSSYCLTAYSTSKAALNMFTTLQCKEFKPSKI